VADAVASATVAAVVVDVAVVALTVVAVAVAVAARSTVVASATSPARRSLSTKRVVACQGLTVTTVRKCEDQKAFVGFVFCVLIVREKERLACSFAFYEGVEHHRHVGLERGWNI
jgi:hypothetical protein